MSTRSERPMLTRLFLVLVPLLMLTSGLRADHLVVNRRVSVKARPAASAAPVARVEPGRVLTLASTQLTNNYYKVNYPEGRSSWVYRGFVTLTAGPPPAPAADPPGGLLKVHMLNVGQGDAILVVCPDGDHQMLIDSGDWRYTGASTAFKNAMTLLQPTGDPIEVVVSSHPHSDHIGNMEWLLRQYSVGSYVDNGQDYDSATYRKVAQALDQRGVRHFSVEASAPDIDFCPRQDVSAVVLRYPTFGTASDPNDNSVVVRLEFGEDTFLFVGDAEEEQEHLLLGDPAVRGLLDCDFLKVGHHGSDTSSTEEFLDAVTPDVAALSAGLPKVSTNSTYMHPRLSTVQRLLQHVRAHPASGRSIQTYDALANRWVSTDLDGALYCTPLEGDLVFESNGAGITYRP